MGFSTGFSSPGVVDAESLTSLPGLESVDLTIDYNEGVATRADRDAIPLENRYDKMQVFVKDTETTYILRGDLSNNANWQTIHQGRCGEVYDYTLNIHVATPANGGSDETGDGTRTKPFATVPHALSKVPDRYSDPNEEFPATEEPYYETVTIRVASGSYDFESGDTDSPWWKGDLNISIVGEMEVVEPTVTFTSQTITDSIITTLTLSSPISTIVDNDEDYILLDSDYNFYGGIVLSGSTQNSLKVLLGGNTIPAGNYKLLKHATFFTPTSFDLTYSRKSSTKRLHDSIQYIKFEAPLSFLRFQAPFSFRHCSLIGDVSHINSLYNCYYRYTPTSRAFPMFNPDNPNSRADRVYIKNARQINNVNESNNGSLILAACVFDNSYFETGYSGFKTSVSLLRSYVKNVNTFLIINAPNTTVSLYSSFTVENVNTFANISQNGTLFRRPGFVQVTGATTSTPIIIQEGSATGIKGAILLTNSTNPGEEIIVGSGNAPISFSALPAVDLNTLSKAT